MNDNINDFLNKICKEVRYKDARPYIREEIEVHIMESADCLRKNDTPEQESISEAIRRMGDPTEIGKNLDKINRPKKNIPVLSTLIILLTAGFLISRRIGIAETYYLHTILIISMTSIIVFAAGYFCDYKKVEMYSYRFVACGLLCLVLYYAFYVFMRRGNYINTDFLSYQIVTLAIPLYTVLYIRTVTVKISEVKSIIMFMVISALFILLLPGAGIFNSLLIIMISVVLTLSVIFEKYEINKSKKYIYYFSVCATSLMVMAVILYKIGFYNRLLDEISIMPENISQGEYVLRYIALNYGKVPVILIIGVSVFMTVNLFLSANAIRDLSGRFFVTVTAVVFSFEIALNILVGLDVFPYIQGANMPFVSHGKTSYLVNLLMLGIAMGIYRRSNIVYIKCEHEVLKS